MSVVRATGRELAGRARGEVGGELAVPVPLRGWRRVRWAARLGGVVAVAALWLLPWLFFWRLFAVGQDAASLPGGDFDEFYLPIRAFAARELARGHLPFWNPHLFGGMPAVSEPEHALFYPVHYLLTPFAALDPAQFARVLAAEIPLHLGLAGWGMYLLGRRLWDSRLVAWFAATTFVFGGYALSYPVQQMNVMATWAWLPLALALLHRGAATAQTSAFAFAGLAIGVAVLAGHPHTAFLVVTLSLVWAAWQTWQQPQRAANAARSLLFLAVAGLVPAIQWLPALLLLPETVREAPGLAFGARGFAPSEYAGLILAQLPFTGDALYVGVPALMLAVAGALSAGRARRTAPVFWCVVLGVAVLLSLGATTALHGALYLLCPPLRLFRNPERVAVFISLALAVLAGHGLHQALTDSGPATARRLRRLGQVAGLGAAGLAATGTALALAWSVAGPAAQGELYREANRLWVAAIFAVAAAACLLKLGRPEANRRFWCGALTALVLIDLASASGPAAVADRSPESFLDGSAIAAAIQADRDRPFRVESEGLLPADGNAGSLFDFEDLTGNTPFALAAWQRFARDIPEWRRWSLLGVRYVVTRRDLADPRLQPVTQTGDAHLYRLADAATLPRARFVTSVIPARTDDELFALTRDAPDDAVVLLNPAATVAEAQPLAPVRVRVDRLDTDRLRLRLQTPVAGMVALGEVWATGWHAEATPGGASYPVLRADGALQAIPVAPGRHDITLRYDPPGLVPGAALSLLGLLLAAAGLLLRGGAAGAAAPVRQRRPLRRWPTLDLDRLWRR